MKVFLFILRNLEKYNRVFYFVAAVSVINGAASFFIPVTLAQFANDPLASDSFLHTLLLIISLYIISLAASYVVRGRGEALSKNFANIIRLKYFRELSLLPLGALRRKHSVYMQSLVNRVADGIGSIVFALFWHLFPGVLLIILFFAYIARESFLVALLNLTIMIGFVIASSLLARKMIPIAAEQNRRNASLLGSYADFMANITTVVQLGIRPFSQQVLEKHAKASNQQTDALQQFHARKWFLLHSLFGLAYILTIGFLIWQIAIGASTAGLLILFVSAYGMLRGQIESLSENVRLFMEIKAYLHELEETLGHIDKKGTGYPKTWKKISMRHVAFRYAEGRETIRIPEFSITTTQKICIEGKSGQGKSTFLGLLSNAYQPQEGKCLIDKKAYKTIGRPFFETNVAVIAQEAELFHLSVRDNILLGQSLSDDRIIRYLDELELREWFNGLADGLDSMIGEKGVTLSAGQRQRLNILRAIILNRPLYILDEPTSHLDKHTEQIVISFLQKHLAKKAAVIVTHRPALRSICDITYKMHEHTLLPSS